MNILNDRIAVLIGTLTIENQALMARLDEVTAERDRLKAQLASGRTAAQEAARQPEHEGG